MNERLPRISPDWFQTRMTCQSETSVAGLVVRSEGRGLDKEDRFAYAWRFFILNGQLDVQSFSIYEIVREAPQALAYFRPTRRYYNHFDSKSPIARDQVMFSEDVWAEACQSLRPAEEIPAAREEPAHV